MSDQNHPSAVLLLVFVILQFLAGMLAWPWQQGDARELEKNFAKNRGVQQPAISERPFFSSQVTFVYPNNLIWDMDVI